MTRSNKKYTQPLPAIDRQASYAVQVAPVVERMRAFLASRVNTCALPVNTEATRSPLELTPSAKDGTQAYHTFNRRQVKEIVAQIVAIMSEKPSPTAVRDNIPSYWLNDDPATSHLVKALTLPYTPTKGKNADVELNAAAHCLAAYRNEVRRMEKANNLTATLKAGKGWFAEGVVDNKGEARPYTSEKKARKAWCRLTHGDDWYTTDKVNRLAAAKVYQQADSVGKRGQGKVSRLAAASLDDMHHATVRSLAKKAGAPKRVFSNTKKARQWFSDDVTRLEGVMNAE